MKIIAVYVDDLIFVATSLDEIQQGLSETFKMKDMGQLRYCLGINFEACKRSTDSTGLCSHI